MAEVTTPGGHALPAATLQRPAVVAPRQRLRRGLAGRLPGSRYARGVAALTAAGLVLRVAWLGHQALWRDEAFTLLAARRPWPEMLDIVRHDSAPPLSYILTHQSLSFSPGPVALRLPEALAGSVAVPLAAALGRRLGGHRGGIHAAALVAVMPALLLASRDARMYSLAGVLSLGVVLALWRALESPSRPRLCLLALATGAALMTQYLTALLVVAAGLSALAALRPPWSAARRCAAATAAGALPLLVWLPLATPQLAHAGSPFWVKPVRLDTMLGVVTQFLCGPAIDPWVPGRGLVIDLQAGALVLGALAGLWLLACVPRMASAERRAHAYVLGAGGGAILLLLLASLRTPLVEARYTSVMWTPLAVLLGCGVARLGPAALRLAVLTAMAAAAIALAVVPTRADVAALTARIDGHVGGHDLVLADPDLYLQALVTLDASAAARTHVPQATIEWYWGVAAYPPGALLGRVPDDAGTVYVLDHPAGLSGTEVAAPPIALPPGYRRSLVSCAAGACLEVFVRG